MPVTLYNLTGSPPCGFVRCVAKHIGVELKVRNLDLANKEQLGEEYLKVNPFHKVPAIDDDGFVVYESSAIAYYLLRKYAPESELYPNEIKARTRIDQALAALSGTVHAVHPLAAVFFRPGFFVKKTPTAAEVIAYEENVLNNIQHLVGDGKYAIGDKLTLADLTIVSHLAMILEIDCVDRSKYPKLVSYYKSLKAQLPYFEEIYRPVICYVKQHWASMQ
ncbi:glutathione S-transferase 1 isoform X2 [Dermacentor silvarum]|uniref:glutathione S-transferase 1 isoform X2 n=1 Tax=Dermacentor silvarum TaxID=543639 RepID=UPI002101A6E6|nr:glutathione S-transferase 1 isoform X2 [Dermacentor silvarum]